MIKNIIRQLLHIAKRLYAQLSDSEIVRIVKAWAVQLLGKKEEQASIAPQQKVTQKAQRNYTELLTGPTGSRCFFCQPVEHVVGAVIVDHDQLYAQLMAEIAKGKPLYFTKEEEQEIEQHNKGYYKFSPVNDVFSRYYTAPGSFTNLKTDKSISWLSASELFDELKAQAPRALQGVTIKRITKEMRRLGVHRRHLSEGNVWGVKKISV